jgi:hypothetical protein
MSRMFHYVPYDGLIPLQMDSYKTGGGIALSAKRCPTGWIAEDPDRGKKLFSSLQGPNQHWGSSNLLSNVYGGDLSSEVSDHGVKLTTHLYLGLRLRIHGAISPLHHCTS